jgi:peptide/nickel transport system permease protein
MLSYKQFVIRRILVFIPMCVIISFILWYLIFEFLKFDPLVTRVGLLFRDRATSEQLWELRVKYGLDKPWLERYFIHMQLILSGDFGENLIGRPVFPMLINSIRITFPMIFISIILGLVIGIPLGIKTAINKNSKSGALIKISYLLPYSIPVFISASLFKFLWFLFYYGIAETFTDYNLAKFATFRGFYNDLAFQMPNKVFFGLLDPFGIPVIDSFLTFDLYFFLDALLHIMVMSFIIATSLIPYILMLTRSGMEESLTKDYITLARAKGLREKVIIYRHALRNSISPVVTYIGVFFGNLLMADII